MASNFFRGDSQSRSQISTHTVGGTAANGQVYTVTINLKDVTYTATGSDTNATITTSLLALLQASTIPEFREVTWTSSSLVISGTGSSDGKPFTSTSASSGTGTLVAATATAATSRNHWDAAENWSLGAVPVDTDDVYIEACATDILYGLSQTGIALNSLNIAASYTGRIGLPDVATGGTGYREYRDKYLSIESATTVNIGYGPGSGSGFMRLNLGTTAAATVNVSSTGRSSDRSVKALMLQGSHASNVLNIRQGSIALALNDDDTARFPVIRVGSLDSPSSDVDLYCGPGCTLAGTITQVGGKVITNTAVTTWTKYGGTSENHGTSTITTLTQDGQSSHYWLSSGTITTVTCRGNQAFIDMSRDLRGRTATNMTFSGGAYLYDPAKTVTFTNAISVDAASANAIFSRNGFGTGQFSLQRS